MQCCATNVLSPSERASFRLEPRIAKVNIASKQQLLTFDTNIIHSFNLAARVLCVWLHSHCYFSSLFINNFCCTTPTILASANFDTVYIYLRITSSRSPA